MTNKQFIRIGYYFIGVITLGIWSLLAYNYFHGGVPRHHLLADPTLPSISNWWGALLLPLLASASVYFVRKRMQASDEAGARQVVMNAFRGFLLAAVFGLSFASLFMAQQNEVLNYLVMVLPLLAFLFPLYRAEFILGFALGMTYAIGAVLPTAFASLVALMSAVLYLGVRPLILWVGSKIFSSASSK
jgi:hypothetical protein